MTEEALCRFASDRGMRKPYYVTDWNGYQVYDVPRTPGAIAEPAFDEPASDEEEDIFAPEEEPPFILVRGEEIRLTSKEECHAIVAFLPPEESCCEDMDEE